MMHGWTLRRRKGPNINAEITDEKEGVVTYMVDANYTDGASTDYLGKVAYTDDEFAEENGDVEIDQYADEVKDGQ